mmetsp:Transcript_87550/g.155274  ORF Transcript_87550/g.155274 Transcript_87550/m.155274 type:complete len:83 (+) Transcript_87550:234-482(+)
MGKPSARCKFQARQKKFLGLITPKRTAKFTAKRYDQKSVNDRLNFRKTRSISPVTCLRKLKHPCGDPIWNLEKLWSPFQAGG